MMPPLIRHIYTVFLTTEWKSYWSQFKPKRKRLLVKLELISLPGTDSCKSWTLTHMANNSNVKLYNETMHIRWIKLNDNNSSGLDVIAHGFYNKCWNILEEPFPGGVNESFNKGVVPTSVISMIFRKKVNGQVIDLTTFDNHFEKYCLQYLRNKCW